MLDRGVESIKRIVVFQLNMKYFNLSLQCLKLHSDTRIRFEKICIDQSRILCCIVCLEPDILTRSEGPTSEDAFLGINLNTTDPHHHVVLNIPSTEYIH